MFCLSILCLFYVFAFLCYVVLCFVIDPLEMPTIVLLFRAIEISVIKAFERNLNELKQNLREVRHYCIMQEP